MKLLVPVLCLMLLFCGCGGNDTAETSSLTGSNTSSQYVDADVDFTGKVTLIGRWHCQTETKNGETVDVSKDGIYYIFSSDGTVDSFYGGESMGIYSGYTTKDDTVTIIVGNSYVTLKYYVTETTLTLSTLNGDISTVYIRVPYEK